MTDELRNKLQQAHALLSEVERELTKELHEPGRGSRARMKIAVEYGGVAAAIAALETVG